MHVQAVHAPIGVLTVVCGAPPTPDFYYINDDCKVRPGGRVQQIWNTLRRYLLSVHARRDYFSPL